jgi:hypothetical protein
VSGKLRSEKIQGDYKKILITIVVLEYKWGSLIVSSPRSVRFDPVGKLPVLVIFAPHTLRYYKQYDILSYKVRAVTASKFQSINC